MNEKKTKLKHGRTIADICENKKLCRPNVFVNNGNIIRKSDQSINAKIIIIQCSCIHKNKQKLS